MRKILFLVAMMCLANDAFAVRTALVAIQAPAPFGYPTVNTSLTMTAADVGNGNSLVLTGEKNDFLIIQNSGATWRTFTITSVADPATGRTGSLSLGLGAGELVILGPWALLGWLQADGALYFNGEHAEVKFAHVRIH